MRYLICTHDMPYIVYILCSMCVFLPIPLRSATWVCHRLLLIRLLKRKQFFGFPCNNKQTDRHTHIHTHESKHIHTRTHSQRSARTHSSAKHSVAVRTSIELLFKLNFFVLFFYSLKWTRRSFFGIHAGTPLPSLYHSLSLYFSWLLFLFLLQCLFYFGAMLAIK